MCIFIFWFKNFGGMFEPLKSFVYAPDRSYRQFEDTEYSYNGKSPYPRLTWKELKRIFNAIGENQQTEQIEDGKLFKQTFEGVLSLTIKPYRLLLLQA